MTRRLVAIGAVAAMAFTGCGDDRQSEITSETDDPPSAPTAESAGAPTTDATDATSVTTSVTVAELDTNGNETGAIDVVGSPDLTPPELVVRDTAFPLSLSADGTHLVDRDGVPFLIHGDAAWSLIVQLDLDEVDAYLDARRAQGFNTLVVNLIESYFAADAPRNTAGEGPFERDGDFTKPNPAYFDHAAEVLDHAADRGLAVLLTPAYLGYGGEEEGWYEEMSAVGNDALEEYGRFVGERFADADNVIWVLGGDYTPPAEGVEMVEAVHQGLVDGGAGQLQTAHWARDTSAADVDIDWLDLNTTYVGGLVYEKSLLDDQLELPHFLIEGLYEDSSKATPRGIRAQAYQSWLTGALGHVYGHRDVWHFSGAWAEQLDSTGSHDMVRARALWDALPWTELEFDLDQRLLVDGTGEFGTEDFAVTASTPGDAVIVAYVPTERDELELDLGPVGTVSIRWYDPTDGTYRAADAAAVSSERIRLAYPGKNAAGDEDWILLVERNG